MQSAALQCWGALRELPQQFRSTAYLRFDATAVRFLQSSGDNLRRSFARPHCVQQLQYVQIAACTSGDEKSAQRCSRGC
jgi:hypothetical protein